ncbi:LPXTG cell wall anchor domain-containing protein [Microbacterium sp. BG28]|uniref:LPXTG cell wall anchor domain-containing protein n=1 Tax=Microbacterium sp. BG28 TaxID=3097356 RepID=UPI002A5A9767|nr:LPXTG cell wall anchor domain-containing protein [Microbacterium sp. BG28]MDY0827971.1 LPXTG cell wall anchor domain-containing protein [Microbacterium sp. BG28]
MKSLRTKIAAVILTAAALVAAPAAAQAYVPTPGEPDAAVSGAPTPGGTVTLVATAFDGNTPISFVVTGENGAGITQASVKLAVSSSPTFNTSTNAAGNASFNVKLPSNATGSYDVAVTGQKNGVSVTETTSFAVGTGSGGTGSGSGLPATGVDSGSLMGVWIGGGVLLLGGLAVTVFAVRRQRQGA